MKLVIDIDDKLYGSILLNCVYGYPSLTKAIKNSTPLPKGHGRLIDADYLREDFKTSKKYLLQSEWIFLVLLTMHQQS